MDVPGFSGKEDRRNIQAVFVFFLIFYLPLALANVYYMDDNARALYGYTWSRSGRVFSTVLMNLLDLNSRNIVDIAPFGQMIGLGALTCSAVLLAKRITGERAPDLVSLCLYGAPIVVQPFFLENLSYKFDALPMCLAQALAVVGVIVCEKGRFREGCGWGAVSTFAVMAFYQPGLNTFLAASVLLFVCDVRGGAYRQAWDGLARRMASLIVAYAAYKILIVRWFVRGDYEAVHSVVMGVHDDISALLMSHAVEAARLVGVLFHGGAGIVLGAAYALGTGYAVWVAFGAMRRPGLAARCAGVFVALSPAFLLVLLPGIVLVLKSPVFEPRVFMSFSVCMIFSSLIFLDRPRGSVWRMVALWPTVYCLVLAYVYGNVLKENARYQTHLIERIGDRLDMAGFAAGDDLFLYGWERRSPIIDNTIKVFPVLGRLLPRQGIRDDDIFGYVGFRDNGVNSREHRHDEWERARGVMRRSFLVDRTARFSVYRSGHVFCVQLLNAAV